MVTGGAPRSSRRTDCCAPAVTTVAASTVITTKAVRCLFVTGAPSMTEMQNDAAAARAQVVNHAGVRLEDVIVDDGVHIGNTYLQRRLMHVVGQLEPQAEAGGAERHAEV